MIRMLADEIEQRCIDENHEIIARAMSGPDLENGKELERLWNLLGKDLICTDNEFNVQYNVFLRETLKIDPDQQDLSFRNIYFKGLFLRRCFDHGLTRAIEMTYEAQDSISHDKAALCTINIIKDTPEIAYAEVQYYIVAHGKRDISQHENIHESG